MVLLLRVLTEEEKGQERKMLTEGSLLSVCVGLYPGEDGPLVCNLCMQSSTDALIARRGDRDTADRETDITT